MLKVDRITTQVNRVTWDNGARKGFNAYMPVATFIFRNMEIDEIHYSTYNRLFLQMFLINHKNYRGRMSPALVKNRSKELVFFKIVLHNLVFCSVDT